MIHVKHRDAEEAVPRLIHVKHWPISGALETKHD